MKKLVFVLVALVTILSMVSCTPKPAASTEPATIHVITMDQAAMSTSQFDDVAKEFMAANPNIKVEMTYVPYEQVHDKIVTGMAATPPAYDAAMIDVIWPDEFIKANYLLLKNIAATGLQWSDYREREPVWVQRVQAELYALWADGKLKPYVSERFPLERFADALAHFKARGVLGKMVLLP